ncbi:low temperature requirement protein A [Micromonospora sp. NPDC053740]|uniref:low temperature requirement protein A n=1 Tax=Micromonospora sp. NPDC053740 TaxID=3155173 RepID=UPI00341680A6
MSRPRATPSGGPLRHRLLPLTRRGGRGRASPSTDAAAGVSAGAKQVPLIIGVLYIALGMEQILDQLAHESAQRGAEMQLSWIATATLFGGTALYFGARAIFMKVVAGYSIRGALIAVGLAVLLIPAAGLCPRSPRSAYLPSSCSPWSFRNGAARPATTHRRWSARRLNVLQRGTWVGGQHRPHRRFVGGLGGFFKLHCVLLACLHSCS